MVIVYLIIFFIIFYYSELKGGIQHLRTRNRIYSKDGLRVTFVYSVPYTEDQVIEILSHKNAGDRLYYEFDKSSMEIWFSNPEEFYYDRKHRGARFKIILENSDDMCLLYVEQQSVNISNAASYVGCHINDFWAAKLDAKPYDVKLGK